MKNMAEYLSLKDWEDIQQFVEVLKPVHIATKKLQEEQLFLSDFYKIWLEMRLSIENNQNSHLLLKLVQTREKAILEHPSVLSALYLDPRIRCILSDDPQKIKRAQMHLKQLIVQIINLKVNIKLFFYLN